MKKLVLLVFFIIAFISCNNNQIRMSTVEPKIGIESPIDGFVVSERDSFKLWKVKEIKYDSVTYLIFISLQSDHVSIVKK